MGLFMSLLLGRTIKGSRGGFILFLFLLLEQGLKVQQHSGGRVC